MNDEPDYKALSAEHKISVSTLKSRYRKQGLRGKDLIAPIQSREAYSRKGLKNSPWRKASPAIAQKKVYN